MTLSLTQTWFVGKLLQFTAVSYNSLVQTRICVWGSLSLSLVVLQLSYLVQADLELTLLSTGMDRLCITGIFQMCSRQPSQVSTTSLYWCTHPPIFQFFRYIKNKIRSKSLVRMKSGTLGTNTSQAVVLWTGGARQPLVPQPAELKVLASWEHFLLSPRESSGNILAPGKHQSLSIMALASLIFLSSVSWPH